jgi:L-seryl-tRNA(Ser) seleniumtransferase
LSKIGRAKDVLMPNLAELPAVYEVLTHPRLATLAAEADHALLVAEIQACLERHRALLRAGRRESVPSADDVAAEVAAAEAAWNTPNLQPVINLTGTLLHTNLGRAPLSAEAMAAVTRAAGTVNLEYDLETGRRGDRDDLVEELLCRLTGAEAATVVNNNAAAVYLALNTLANKGRVAVSRGELVEIGASFRMPDIIRASGCRMMEVGTTNRTHLADYEKALDDGGRLLLKVHTSNYRVVGFVRDVPLAELAKLGRTRDVPVVADLGSGALVDMRRYGVAGEPTVQEAVRAAADLVTFSGDKLLGGPQAGIVVGRARHLKRVKRNPMKRALRCDKLRLAALEATLRAYLSPRTLDGALPAYRMMARPLAEISTLAETVRPHVERWAGDRADVAVMAGESQIGSGAAPDAAIPTVVLALTPRRNTAAQLAVELRALTPAVVGRLHEGKLLLDMRPLLDPEPLIAALHGTGDGP